MIRTALHACVVIAIFAPSLASRLSPLSSQTVKRDTVFKRIDVARHAPLVATIEREIGRDTDGTSFSFGRIACIAALRDGGVVALDAKGPDGVPVLRMFDHNGNPGRVLGRKGSGPGEYQMLSPTPCLAVSSTGTILLLDRGNDRIDRWQPDGAALTAIRLPVLPSGPPPYLITGSGETVYVRAQLARPQMASRWDRAAYGFIHVGPDGAVLDTVGPHPEWVRPAQGSPLEREDIWLPLHDGRVIAASTDRLGFVLAGTPGHLPTAFVGDMSPVPVSDGERKEQGAIMKIGAARAGVPVRDQNLPSLKPILWADQLLPDNDGRIWMMLHTTAVHNNSLVLVPATATQPAVTVEHYFEPPAFAAFSTAGNFLGQIRLPLAPGAAMELHEFAMEGNTIWGVVTSSDDEPLLVKWGMH